MIVAHNLMAMNAQRQFGITNDSQVKSTRKLSSGYKINYAADDAAGLAISEKMRRQIRGLTQASLNCQDGISMMQVADGALSEMSDIMQRMNELAVKAANGTLDTADREAINEETQALIEELRRIQNATTFNEIPLFKPGKAVKIDAEDYGNVRFDETGVVDGSTFNGKTIDFSGITQNNKDMLSGRAFQITCSQSCKQIFDFSFKNGGGSSVQLDYSTGATRPSLYVEVDLDECTDGASIVKKISDLADSQRAGMVGATRDFVYIGHANGLDVDGAKMFTFAATSQNNAVIKAADIDVGFKEIPIQAGSEAGDEIPIFLYDIGPAALSVSRADVSTIDGAKAAIGMVKTGLMKLSEYRSYYGATQNRLEHTIKNLDNVVENTTAAESLIRDTDMASEMVRYSNNNILLQAGTAMMAQANQANSSVLSLLQ